MEESVNNVPYNLLKTHYRKLFLEHQKLQLEHGRLRKKFSDHQINSKFDDHQSSDSINHNNKPTEDLKRELEKEKSLTKALNADVKKLNDNLKIFESRYVELLEIFTSQKDSDNQNDKIKKLENEIKELKETLEFVQSENQILKDSEDKTFAERLEWLEEKKKFEHVVVWSKHINDKLKATLIKNEDYAKQVDRFNKLLNFLFDFFAKHHQSSPNDDSNVIENYNKCSAEDIEKKIDLMEKLLKALMHKNDENSNILNENPQEFSKKTKLSDLYKENEILKETSKCLTEEICELKNMLHQKDISSNEIDSRIQQAKLSAELKHKEEILEKLSEKFARNRNVLEENCKKLTEEIKLLDNFIAMIIEKLNNLPTELKQNEALQELIKMVNENESEFK